MNVKCEKFQQSNQNMDLAESELLIWRGPQLPGGTGGHLSSWKNYHYTISSDLQKTDRLDIHLLNDPLKQMTRMRTMLAATPRMPRLVSRKADTCWSFVHRNRGSLERDIATF